MNIHVLAVVTRRFMDPEPSEEGANVFSPLYRPSSIPPLNSALALICLIPRCFYNFSLLAGADRVEWWLVGTVPQNASRFAWGCIVRAQGRSRKTTLT